VRVHPGDRVDGRYLVYEQTDENWGVCGWRAHDQVLGRDVLLTTFHPQDPRAASLVEAARAASRVTDHRFVRVLDAQVDSPTGFLVREWVGGRSLADVLSAGPLPEDYAADICRDVAEALTAAHDVGLEHLCVDPTSVFITDDGAVRVRGLGTAAVLRGVHAGPSGAARDDTVGIGRILYAALTARSATEGPSPLPTVPRVDDTVPAPRQVRAGVSPLLDAITVRALGSGRSRRYPPYRHPREVAQALARVSKDRVRPPEMATIQAGHDTGVVDPAPVPPPRPARPALDRLPQEQATARPEVPLLLPGTPADGPRRDRRWLRAATIAAAVVIGIGGVLLGIELISTNRVPDLDPQSSPTAGQDVPDATTAAPEPDLPATLQVVDAQEFDPYGDGQENSSRTGLAIDGDTTTTWPTQTYFDPLEVQKPGVGLLLDLGRPAEVGAVDLVLPAATSDVEVRLGPDDPAALPPTQEGFDLLGRAEDVGETVTVSGEPRSTRFVLVWFTRLPPGAEGWRGGISEAVVRG